jgi:hypothetical protein
MSVWTEDSSSAQDKGVLLSALATSPYKDSTGVVDILLARVEMTGGGLSLRRFPETQGGSQAGEEEAAGLAWAIALAAHSALYALTLSIL